MLSASEFLVSLGFLACLWIVVPTGIKVWRSSRDTKAWGVRFALRFISVALLMSCLSFALVLVDVLGTTRFEAVPVFLGWDFATGGGTGLKGLPAASAGRKMVVKLPHGTTHIASFKQPRVVFYSVGRVTGRIYVWGKSFGQ